MVPLLRTLFGIVLGGIVARLATVLGRFHSGHSSARSALTRRGFVRNAALGSVTTILAGSAVGFYQFFTPNKTGAFGGNINVSASQVPAVGAAPLKNPQGKFWLVHNEDGVLALYWKCVHLGCTVPWNASSSEFVCPCHGSVYDPNGVRIAGPAPRPLDYMGVTVDASGNLTVNTGDIRTRGSYSPDQATPYTA
jgi:cytochrome b6-f complex iron-sulfur subunit